MRIAYWSTSCLQPEIEAISKEVFQLAIHFRPSFVFSISPHLFVHASYRRKYLGFHPRFDPFLRILIPLLERRCSLSHVYGEMVPWTFYKALHSKPLVLTITSEKNLPGADFLHRCKKILVQTETSYQKLLALGFSQEKIELMYPGVDLETFRPTAETPKRPRNGNILFATAPRSKEEMEGRGVHLLIAAAKESPDTQYHFLYRKWSGGHTSLSATRREIVEAQLRNITLTNDGIPDMPRVYNDHDFTIIPYTRANGGKECPMSLVEGLACGVPALISSVAPFASFIEARRCGVVFEPRPSCLVTAIETGLRNYAELSACAVQTARQYFSDQLLIRRMEKVYREATI